MITPLASNYPQQLFYLTCGQLSECSPHIQINQELQRSVDRRVSEESCAVEVAMSAARECILKHKPIDLDWKLEVSLM